MLLAAYLAPQFSSACIIQFCSPLVSV